MDTKPSLSHTAFKAFHMKSIFSKIKEILTNQARARYWKRMRLGSDIKKENVNCFGVNKEGVACPRALECARYTPHQIETRTYINFPEDYDIKNCEIYKNINNNEH